jgi:hypothetical protein
MYTNSGDCHQRYTGKKNEGRGTTTCRCSKGKECSRRGGGGPSVAASIDHVMRQNLPCCFFLLLFVCCLLLQEVKRGQGGRRRLLLVLRSKCTSKPRSGFSVPFFDIAGTSASAMVYFALRCFQCRSTSETAPPPRAIPSLFRLSAPFPLPPSALLCFDVFYQHRLKHTNKQNVRTSTRTKVRKQKAEERETPFRALRSPRNRVVPHVCVCMRERTAAAAIVSVLLQEFLSNRCCCALLHTARGNALVSC